MLTHCPECQKELSTAATQCPHCGAPVNQGHLAGGAPVAKPVSPGYAQPGYPQQPGYAQPMQPQQPPQPQSHCLRNCIIVGCIITFLVVAAVVAFPVYVYKKLASSVSTDPQVALAMGQKVAPGATPPEGYKPKFAIDLSMFGQKVQGTFISNGKGDQPDPTVDTVIAWGALKQKQNSNQLQQSFHQALNAKKGDQNGNAGNQQTVEKQEEVELTIAGQPTKVLHMIMLDEKSGKKVTYYFVVLDDWKNDFGWLGIVAAGPDDTFDLDGFKAFLASLKR